MASYAESSRPGARSAAETFDFLREYNDKKDLKLDIGRVRFEGNEFTNEAVLQREFASVYTASTLDELRDALLEAQQNLMALGVYQSAKVVCDRSRTGRANEVDVTVSLKERRRNFKLEVSTTKGEMNGSVAAVVYNVLGYADTHAVEVARGTYNSTIFKVGSTFPYLSPFDRSVGTIDLFQSSVNAIYSSFAEQVRGTTLTYKGLNHKFAVDLHWRDVRADIEKASISVREQAGSSLKASLRHELVVDERDDPLVPTDGFWFKLLSEVAGLFGNVSFLKHEAFCQRHFPLAHGLALGLGVAGGLMIPLDGRPSRINDRFFLGGPASLRGFRTHGIGPHDQSDSLGGTAYGAASVSLSAPFIWSKTLHHLGWRAHTFVNAGNLILPSKGLPMRNHVRQMVERIRIAAGAGLVIPFMGVGRIELNLCHALRKLPHDTSSGFQVGFGVNI